MRVLLKKLIHVVQATNRPGVGAMLPAFFLNLTRNGLARGGAQNLPEALARIVVEEGGTVLTGRPGGRINVRDGQAVGVELSDGTEVRAARAVVAGVSFTQMVEMTGPDRFSVDVRDKAENWDWNSGGSLATVHLALREAPHYKGADFDPDVDRAYNVSFGVDDSAELVESRSDVTSRRFPAL